MTPEEIAARLQDRSTWESGWQTRDGRPVRILAGNLKSGSPIVVAIALGHGVEIVGSRFPSGTTTLGEKNDGDLIPRPRKVSGLWVVLEKQSSTGKWYSIVVRESEEEAAKIVAANASGRIAFPLPDFEEPQ